MKAFSRRSQSQTVTGSSPAVAVADDSFGSLSKADLKYFAAPPSNTNQDSEADCPASLVSVGSSGDEFSQECNTQCPRSNLMWDGIALTNYDLHCLDDGCMLNDTVVEFFLRLMRKCLGEGKHVHIFSPHFFTRLQANGAADGEAGWENVKGWTKRVSLFAQKQLVVPINLANHWWLAVVQLPDLDKQPPSMPTLYWVDSCRGSGERYAEPLHYLRGYLHKEWTTSRDIFVQDGTSTASAKSINFLEMQSCSVEAAPQQENFVDCGIFLLENVLELLGNLDALSSSEKIGETLWCDQDRAVQQRDKLRQIVRVLNAEAVASSSFSVPDLLQKSPAFASRISAMIGGREKASSLPACDQTSSRDANVEVLGTSSVRRQKKVNGKQKEKKKKSSSSERQRCDSKQRDDKFSSAMQPQVDSDEKVVKKSLQSLDVLKQIHRKRQSAENLVPDSPRVSSVAEKSQHSDEKATTEKDLQKQRIESQKRLDMEAKQRREQLQRQEEDVQKQRIESQKRLDMEAKQRREQLQRQEEEMRRLHEEAQKKLDAEEAMKQEALRRQEAIMQKQREDAQKKILVEEKLREEALIKHQQELQSLQEQAQKQRELHEHQLQRQREEARKKIEIEKLQREAVLRKQEEQLQKQHDEEQKKLELEEKRKQEALRKQDEEWKQLREELNKRRNLQEREAQEKWEEEQKQFVMEQARRQDTIRKQHEELQRQREAELAKFEIQQKAEQDALRKQEEEWERKRAETQKRLEHEEKQRKDAILRHEQELQSLKQEAQKRIELQELEIQRQQEETKKNLELQQVERQKAQQNREKVLEQSSRQEALQRRHEELERQRQDTDKKSELEKNAKQALEAKIMSLQQEGRARDTFGTGEPTTSNVGSIEVCPAQTACLTDFGSFEDVCLEDIYREPEADEPTPPGVSVDAYQICTSDDAELPGLELTPSMQDYWNEDMAEVSREPTYPASCTSSTPCERPSTELSAKKGVNEDYRVSVDAVEQRASTDIAELPPKKESATGQERDQNKAQASRIGVSCEPLSVFGRTSNVPFEHVVYTNAKECCNLNVDTIQPRASSRSEELPHDTESNTKQDRDPNNGEASRFAPSFEPPSENAIREHACSTDAKRDFNGSTDMLQQRDSFDLSDVPRSNRSGSMQDSEQNVTEASNVETSCKPSDKAIGEQATNENAKEDCNVNVEMVQRRMSSDSAECPRINGSSMRQDGRQNKAEVSETEGSRKPTNPVDCPSYMPSEKAIREQVTNMKAKDYYNSCVDMVQQRSSADSKCREQNIATVAERTSGRIQATSRSEPSSHAPTTKLEGAAAYLRGSRKPQSLAKRDEWWLWRDILGPDVLAI